MHSSPFCRPLHLPHRALLVLACTRFRRHPVKVFNGAGGRSWRGDGLRGSSRTVWIAAGLFPSMSFWACSKHLVPLRSLAKWTWCETTGPQDRLAGQRLTANVLRLSKLLRIADRDGLQRSLLLYRLYLLLAQIQNWSWVSANRTARSLVTRGCSLTR